MIRKLFKSTTLIWLSAIWATVIIVVAVGAFITQPWDYFKQREWINVSATGKTEVRPNIAKLAATVSTKNPNLDQARKQNAEKVTKIIDSLKVLGVDEKDIQTQYLSAGEARQNLTLPPEQRDKTNQITTTFEVTIGNFQIVDEVIATFTQNQVSNLDGPVLTVDDKTLEEAKSQARQKAAENAKKNAQELASVSGRKLGKVMSVKEQGDFRPPTPIYALEEADLQQKASQIQPGQNEVSIEIQATFELK